MLKASPATTAGSHASRRPRRPSTMNTRMSGTKSARMGVCRPTMAPRLTGSRPVILPRVVIGTAMAPKATGAVLATRATAAALTGRMPTAISITAVTATGVPKPASASSSAPKQKAIRIAWTRWSGDTERERPAQHQVVAGELGEPEDPDRRQHDVDDREEPEGTSLGGGDERLAGRHPEEGDGDHDGDDEAGEPGLPGLPLQCSEEHEERDEGQGGHERGERQRSADGCCFWLEHVGLPCPGRYVV